MCILSPDQTDASRAASLAGPARQRLALDALAGVPISHIAGTATPAWRVIESLPDDGR